MSLKYEWPYIQYLSLEDINDYESDLPKDLDRLKVRCLKTTPLWRVPQQIMPIIEEYTTPEEKKLEIEFEIRTFFWNGLYASTMGLSLWSMSKWYSTNHMTNFKAFRSETWPMYVKRRFWPSVFVAWSVYEVVSEKNFNEYPVPYALVEYVLNFNK